jgi:hypothetical protein
VLDVSAADYSFDTGGVVEVPAGALYLNITNVGAEEHQATLVKFNDGVTLADLAAAGASDPTGRSALGLVQGYGGPNSAAPGGGTATAAANVDPGDYLLICLIPSPSDGIPHASKGMVLPLTVTDGEPAPPPANDGTIGLEDYGFTLPADFSGNGLYIVDNQGPQSHELAAYALAPGAKVEDAIAALSGETEGPPPLTPAGGIALLRVGGEAAVQLALSPGEYVFACFIPDEADGAPHFLKGMIQQVTIT